MTTKPLEIVSTSKDPQAQSLFLEGYYRSKYIQSCITLQKLHSYSLEYNQAIFKKTHIFTVAIVIALMTIINCYIINTVGPVQRT